MYSFLRQPRWVIGIMVAIVIVTTFVALGNWQLRRHDEVTLENRIRATRLEEPPLELSALLDAAGPSVDSLEYRRAVVTGRYDPRGELLVRNQVHDGAAGFHVVTPFAFGEEIILVNRGWVPLSVEAPPVAAAPPPEGRTEIEVVLRSSQPRPAVGRVEPEGRLFVVNRIDLDRLAEQFDGLAPVWGQLVASDEESYPIALTTPDFSDDGPHLEYALQWFSFAIIGIVGSGILVRRTAHRRTG